MKGNPVIWTEMGKNKVRVLSLLRMTSTRIPPTPLRLLRLHRLAFAGLHHWGPGALVPIGPQIVVEQKLSSKFSPILNGVGVGLQLNLFIPYCPPATLRQV